MLDKGNRITKLVSRRRDFLWNSAQQQLLLLQCTFLGRIQMLNITYLLVLAFNSCRPEWLGLCWKDCSVLSSPYFCCCLWDTMKQEWLTHVSKYRL